MKTFLDFSERYGARAGGYRDLMREQVRHVLFVSSLYESFILAEDGHLHERVLGKFLEATPRDPPNLTRVSSGREALRLLHHPPTPIDLIISSPHVGDMDAAELAATIRDAGIHVPLAVLGYDHRELIQFVDSRPQDSILATFLWQGDARILLAIVKAVEDRLNVERDTRIGVPAFLLVEDNIRFYSSFLPVIYAEVTNLVEAMQAEAGNRLQRLMRNRARPKILLATTYERAMRDFETYQDSIMGVFSDMEFKREGVLSRSAGLNLAKSIRRLQPDVPIVLQSTNPANEQEATSLDAGFLLKGSPDLLHQLRQALSGDLFFGDFVFRRHTGEELVRAEDLKSLVRILETVEADSISFHAARNDFSRWLRARAEFGLASELRPRRLEDFESVEHLRQELVDSIDRYRRERNRGTVTPFRAELFDAEEGIVLIGEGSLGGKGRGLAFASRLLDEVRLSERFPEVKIEVPPAVVLGTSLFHEFLNRNRLRGFALETEEEEEVVTRFLNSTLPPGMVSSLTAMERVLRGPIAVRSSSLLEDSPYHPFAGVYGTWILPNDDPDPRVRLRHLLDAVRRVYASTFSRRARSFLQASPYRLEEEAMAVIIQRLVGRRHGNRFYPDLAGVARSHNDYPVPPAVSGDGIAAVALGLGKTVAEGEPCLRFSPPHPAHIPEHASTSDMLERSQRAFWALQLGAPAPEGGWERDGPLVHLPLRMAEEDGTLAPVASTYSAENDAVYDGIGRPGSRLVTFAPILKHGLFPLAEILQELMVLGRAGTRLPVEIEFAATLAHGSEPARLGFLQLRPLATSREDLDIRVSDYDPEDVFCESPSVLGHGRIQLHDWVVVDRDHYERGHSVECAAAIRRLNRGLVQEGRSFGLVVVGRLGSTHAWLGIPVRWEDISGARVIVEAGFRDFKVTPSQGTHFYQNLVSLNVGYFTVNADAGEGRVEWDWLAAQPRVETDGPVYHLRFQEPTLAVMDGRTREGVILRPGGSGTPAG
ncbi:MAG: PEP/pyruvate-binding domain-containing protein [Gemmatimonadota bacterium]